MKGPINKDRKIAFGLDGLEVASIFAGLLVVLGLLMESGPEVWQNIMNRVWPQRGLVGGALVTLGVFAEVAIGVFIARAGKRAQSEAGERIALAEKTTAEANLARFKLEALVTRRTISRRLSREEEEQVTEALRPYSGQTFAIQMLVPNTTVPPERAFEQRAFAAQLRGVLHNAGWIEENTSDLAANFVANTCVAITVDPSLGAESGKSLMAVLNRLSISAHVDWVNFRLRPPVIVSVGLL